MGIEGNMRGGSRKKTILIAGIIILLAIAAVLGLFRIRSVNVIGCSRYTPEEIQEDLIYSFPTRNTLYLAWKYRNAKYEERTPYLNSVQVKIESPGTVRIIVSEKKLTGYVQYNGQNVYFDEDGTVLDITDKIYDGVALVTGIEMEEPTLYQKLPVSNTALLHTMLSIAQLIKDADLPASVVSFDENQNITITIGNVRVEIGQAEYLEEKISNLVTIYPKVENQTGVLNMSAFTGKNETITFGAGEEETEAVTEEDSTDEDQFGGVDTSAQTGDEDLLVGGALEDTSQGEAQADQEEAQEEEAQESTGVSSFMVFDSSGTLRYDAHVVDGQVVDSSGNPIDGCSVNENGNVVDAYWNEIDPATGTLAE